MTLDPMLKRALLAEAHQHAGGHQPEIQAHLSGLSDVTARWLLIALREGRTAKQQANIMRRQPWRVLP